jgi:hypothetical protein
MSPIVSIARRFRPLLLAIIFLRGMAAGAGSCDQPAWLRSGQRDPTKPGIASPSFMPMASISQCLAFVTVQFPGQLAGSIVRHLISSASLSP